MPVVTGGDGVHPFEHEQPGGVPAIFEAGTANVSGIMGLAAGIAYSLSHEQDLKKRQNALSEQFLAGLRQVPGLTVYGDFTGPRVPVFAINFAGAESATVSDILWNTYEMATRPGFHCAPLVHRALGTTDIGAVRFSFSSLTTAGDIDAALKALHEIAAL